MTNTIAVDAMWNDAVSDTDALAKRATIVRAKVALAGSWPFLAVATSEEEFEHRLALIRDQIVSRTPPEVLDEVVAGLKNDWVQAHASRTEKAAALRKQAVAVEPHGGGIPNAYVHVHKYATGDPDDTVYQVDHIASPTFLQSLGHFGDRDEAMDRARQFGLPVGLPIYENGRYVEGKRTLFAADEEFFDRKTGRWVSASELPSRQVVGASRVTFHEAYGPVSVEQLRAYRKHNVPPALHNELAFYFGRENHDAITNYVKERGTKHGRIDYGDVYRDKPSASGHLRELEEGGGGWGRWASNYRQDPDKAWRIHYPDRVDLPGQGGEVTAPPGSPSIDPDGFSHDYSEGEDRSQVGYTRQLTPGVWTVPPDANWPADERPNAATGLPIGQYVAPGQNAAGWAMQAPLRTGHLHQGSEGVVDTPGPNPNYFSVGTEGLQGPPVFPQDPAGTTEPWIERDPVDNGTYGGVPPEVSSGSAMNRQEGGYSRMGSRSPDFSLSAEERTARKQAGLPFGGTYEEGREHGAAGLAEDSAYFMPSREYLTGWEHGQDDRDRMHPDDLRDLERKYRTGALDPSGQYVTETPQDHAAQGFYDARQGRHYAGEELQDTEHARAYRAGWDAFHNRRQASTDGKIIGLCDHCGKAVRYHTDKGGHLRHLHNNSDKCADGHTATASLQRWFARAASLNMTPVALYESLPPVRAGTNLTVTPVPTSSSVGSSAAPAAGASTGPEGSDVNQLPQAAPTASATPNTPPRLSAYRDWPPEMGRHYDYGHLDAQHGMPYAPPDPAAELAYRQGYRDAGGSPPYQGRHETEERAGVHSAGKRKYNSWEDEEPLSDADWEAGHAVDRGFTHGVRGDDPEHPDDEGYMIGYRGGRGFATKQGAVLENPSAENPTGRGEDPYRARTTWTGFERQRPRQELEGEGGMNANTPTTAPAPIKTGPNINTPIDTDGPRERDDQDDDDDDDDEGDDDDD